MAKRFLAIFVILVVICVIDSAWLLPSKKSSGGKLKISIEYGDDDFDNECDDKCKGACNNTCGSDPRCRYKCYVEDCHCPKNLKTAFQIYELLGCTTKCREYCNKTCGSVLKCRVECYVKTCQCPPPDHNEDNSEEFNDDDEENSNELYQIPQRSMPQKPQCCPVCMGKCLHRCEDGKSKCIKHCKSKCCHDSSEWN